MFRTVLLFTSPNTDISNPIDLTFISPPLKVKPPSILARKATYPSYVKLSHKKNEILIKIQIFGGPFRTSYIIFYPFLDFLEGACIFGPRWQSQKSRDNPKSDHFPKNTVIYASVGHLHLWAQKALTQIPAKLLSKPSSAPRPPLPFYFSKATTLYDPFKLSTWFKIILLIDYFCMCS